ncbi:hypothetical protein JAAARDRAFT_207288 [Jaapia argillacea MUCL 33604]|uniref:Release factor glutamine methyltransferase N-terminal domain-containing protein n=1 Tax=Jaapia argillacea MUCL 33604 TaxID=933084 RepID=A0A067PSV3_9AGAM|nr:hypothetical protein JAAARDRAFT_207288 [Jaapia argillacea MUCL 33604]
MPPILPKSPSHLLPILATRIGRASAHSELKWMKEALHQRLLANHPDALATMLTRRISGEPLQYILGTQPFGPLNLLTRPPVLIPRPETEDWTLRLSELISTTPQVPMSLLDLCTGSGCIPLLLCHVLPARIIHAYGVDVSEEAIRLATDNAVLCGLSPGTSEDPPKTAFTPILGNIFNSEFPGSLKVPLPVDVLTSNPPYIPRRDYDSLPKSVKDYEDPRALLGDLPESEEQRGLTFYRRIAELIRGGEILKAGGLVALEVGEGQAAPVEDIIKHVAGVHSTEIWRDPWGKERTVVART